MNKRIIKDTIPRYTTTNGKMFTGRGAKKDAERYQNRLDVKAMLDDFDTFLRPLFGISKWGTPKAEEEEQEFGNKITEEVNIDAGDGLFKTDISEFLIDLFTFIGPEKWLKIHGFLTKKKSK